MANSTTWLDTISSSQAQKEVTANAMFDAMSHTLGARRATTCSGLTWGYYGGNLWVDGVLTQIANGTVLLIASNTNYVEMTRAGVISATTAGFTAGSIPLYTIVVGASSVTSYTDNRIPNWPFTGLLALSVAGAANVTLTAAQARNHILHFTGLLTGSINIIVPTVAQPWIVYNGTTGAYTITVKTSAGTGVVVQQGLRTPLYCDGTNVVSALSGLPAASAQNSFLVSGATPFLWAEQTLANTKTILAASEATTGVAEQATLTEAQGLSDTSRFVTSKGVGRSMAMADVPRALSQGINLVGVTSGSNGISSADNANLDFGTRDFSMFWRGSLPDWTPSTYTSYLIYKWVTNTGYLVGVLTSGKLRVYLNGTYYDTTAAPELSNGTAHSIGVTVVRETASVAGSINFYIDGILFESVAITAASPPDISTTQNLQIMGYSGVRTSGTVYSTVIYNMALTAADQLVLHLMGVDSAHKWAATTELMPNAVDRDFSGASAWANVDLSAYDETGDLTITANAAAQYCTLVAASAPTAIGKRYRMTFTVANLVSTWTIQSFDGTQTIGTVSANGTNVLEWTATTTGGYRIVAVGDTSSGDFDDFTLIEIGAVAAFEPEGVQPNPGQWLDSSTNKLHAMQPAAGSSLTRRKKDFEVRWTNTWAGTHEAQYIGGIDQAILPSNCYITDIIGVISGATIEDIILGDGSDTDRWVTITTGLAAGITAFALANRISDGTNYKMVVDPDANFTGSIAWTIRGIILQ